MQPLSERIRAAIAHAEAVKGKKLTKAAIARACKVSGPSVHNWLDGRTTRLTFPVALAAAKLLGVSAEWLAVGKGAMLDGVQEADAPIPNSQEGEALETRRQRLEKTFKAFKAVAAISGFSVDEVLEYANSIKSSPRRKSATPGES